MDIENVLGTVENRKERPGPENHGRHTLLRMTGAGDQRKQEKRDMS